MNGTRRSRLSLLSLALAIVSACASASPVHEVRLTDPARAGEVTLVDLARDARLTVLVFFSSHCPCQRAHDARLVALAERWAPRGVALIAVASEEGFTAADAERERAARGYPFPLVVDPEARLARSVGATFATHVTIVDHEGRVRFGGAIDSDVVKLHDDATPYLEDAMSALTSGRAVGETGRPRGCVLRKS